jgi:hypothetical protein
MNNIFLWVLSNIAWSLLLFIVNKTYKKIGPNLIFYVFVLLFAILSGVFLSYPVVSNQITNKQELLTYITLYGWASICIFTLIFSSFGYFIQEYNDKSWYRNIKSICMSSFVLSTLLIVVFPVVISIIYICTHFIYICTHFTLKYDYILFICCLIFVMIMSYAFIYAFGLVEWIGDRIGQWFSFLSIILFGLWVLYMCFFSDSVLLLYSK